MVQTNMQLWETNKDQSYYQERNNIKVKCYSIFQWVCNPKQQTL